nr:disease resistance-like protein DSC1 [Arachis hypogaea]
MDCLIDRGEDVWPSLERAIEDSHVSIVVFSKDYASSKWCLQELVKILQCRKDVGQVVIPVFYGTDPSQIRGQTGSFEQSFAKHVRGLGDNDIKVKKWRDALTEAAQISGWDSRNLDESQLIENIVNDVLQKRCLRRPIELNGLVGTDEICKNVEILMKRYKVIGIWGMPGIGKTTIANVLFAKLFPQFDKVCYVENVKEYSHDRLISKLLKEEICIPNVVGFQYGLKRLGNKKVFIVLDDVDSLDQVKKWNDPQSLQLFCLKAFNEIHPREGYEVLSASMVEYAGGVPLALRVLGSSLRSKRVDFWKGTLEKLKRYPDKAIQDFYKMSYDGLDEEEKKIFLEIAFFHKGEEKDSVTSILMACGLEARCGMVVLRDKAFISISYNNTIEIHDLLQEIAFEIVRRESSEDPTRRSRLMRDTEEICTILKDNKGTDAIEGIMLDLSQIAEMQLRADAFRRMNNLRFLKLYKPSDQCAGKISLPEDLDSLSDKLVYLEWYGYPLDSLPLNFCAKFLVEIRMSHSNEVSNLERIDLSECKQLIKLPDLSKAKRLRWVNLSGCESLCALHSSVLSSDTLITLILDRCINLQYVKGDKHLKSLENISVNGCSSLEEFAVSSDLIESLDLSNTRIEMLDTSIGRLCKLGSLNLEGSPVKHLPTELCLTSLKVLKLSYDGLVIDKQQLHVLFDGLRSLQILHLKECSNLTEFPDNIGILSKLQELILDGSSVQCLPPSIKHLQRLEILSLKSCKKLRSLPELPPLIHEFCADDCAILKSVSNLKTFSKKMVGKTKHISFKNSLKLEEESLQSVMKSLHLTMIKAVANNVVVRKHRGGYNYNSMEVCLPGSRVPREFLAYKKSESSSIIITELPDSEWLGFIYCVVLSPSEGIRKEGAKLRCQCQLVGGQKGTWLNKAVSELNSDHVYVWYDPLHCDNILRFHPPKVRFEFSVTTDEGEVDGSIHIKECGVLLISFSLVESVLQELELHLPVDLVEEENVLAPEEKPIACYSSQLDTPSEDNQNKSMDLDKSKGLLQERKNALVQRTECTLPSNMKDVAKQAEGEGDSAMAAQLLENLEGPLLDDHVLTLDDHSLMKGHGGPALFRWLQDQALRSASVARYAEQVFQAASRSIAEKDEELRLARDEAVRKQESLKIMEDRLQDLNYQLASWRRKYEEAQEKWRIRESALETEVAMLVASFQNSRLQVQIPYPDIRRKEQMFSDKTSSVWAVNQHGRFFPAASWARPETGFFKVNCDGSVFEDEHKAGFGCVLRDSSGRWVRGCCGKVAVTSGLRLELWSLWRGLLLALEAGIEFLVCETDSMEAFSLVSGWRIPSDHVEKDLVMRFIELKRLQGWTVRFGLIRRDANSVADWLAKEGAHGEAASTVWLHPPGPLQLLLQKDLA